MNAEPGQLRFAMASSNGPSPFDAPWQAQVFALTVALNEAGHLPWSEWVDYFSAELGDQPDVGLPLDAGPAVNDAYYTAWAAALERWCRDRDVIRPLQLGARLEAIRAYARVTPAASLFSFADASRSARAQADTSPGPR
ncbi:MAG: nitrile hydratase accessory protein [Burkholderiaceae bacterium]